MLTPQQIHEYRQLAARFPERQGGKAINHLLDEVQEYRREINRHRASKLDKSGPYSDSTLMPFGKYKGEPLGEVPDDYWRWWLGQNPDWDVIYIESLYAKYPEKAVALQKLKLHDYAKGRNGNKV